MSEHCFLPRYSCKAIEQASLTFWITSTLPWHVFLTIPKDLIQCNVAMTLQVHVTSGAIGMALFESILIDMPYLGM